MNQRIFWRVCTHANLNSPSCLSFLKNTYTSALMSTPTVVFMVSYSLPDNLYLLFDLIFDKVSVYNKCATNICLFQQQLDNNRSVY